MSLIQQKCIPCEGAVAPFAREEAEKHMHEVPGWGFKDISSEPLQIQRRFVFSDFKQAMEFVNNVAELAETEGHHPDIFVHYNEVTLTLWTHAINGLFINDFIVAAKVNELAI